MFAIGPLPTLNARFAHTVGIAKPWTGARRRFGAAVGACGADCAAVLGFRSRRITRFAHCVRCARTDAASQLTKRASTRADRNPGLAGRAGRTRPAARQARTVHWTVRVRARLLAAAQARRAHPPTALRGSLGSWVEKDPSRASSPAGACTRACGARQATGSMPAACLSLTPKNDCARKAAGGAQAGRMAPPRSTGLRSARVLARFVI